MQSTRFCAIALISTAAAVFVGCGDSDKAGLTRTPGKESVVTATQPINNMGVQEATKVFVVTASSKTGDYGPQGLFDTVQPGWHSASPPKYSEFLTVDFLAPREVKFIGLLQQEGQPSRAPKSLRIEISSDGKTWTEVGGSDNACSPNKPDGWFNIDLAKPATTQYMKLVIFSNCGDAKFLTLRGLRVD